MKNIFSRKTLRYIAVICLSCLCIVIGALWLVMQPTPEEKELIEIAEVYCLAITSEDTLKDAWELTDKNYDEAVFLAPPAASTEGVRREKIGPAEIHGESGIVGVTRYYDSDEKKESFIFFNKVDGQWKIELPGK